MAYELRSGNPVLGARTFQNADYAGAQSGVMTVQGTALKTLALTILLFTAGAWSWTQVQQGELQPGFLMGSLIVGAILGVVTAFFPKIAPWTAPLYAVAEGLLLGAISMMFEKGVYKGIAFQAMGLTAGTLFIMMFLYATRMVRVTERLRTAVIAATGAIALLYFISIVLSFFGIRIPMIHESGPIGILFSVVVVGIAAFNLLLDFDQIERGAAHGAPKYLEWYGAFGLLVTLVWLYIEILNLLRKLSDRR